MPDIKSSDKEGFVEFKAYYVMDGKDCVYCNSGKKFKRCCGK